MYWAGREELFQTIAGNRLPALFDKLDELGATEKISIVLHCEDHDHTVFDEQWFISRDGYRQISCTRAAESHPSNG